MTSAPLPPLSILRAGQRVPVAWGHATVLPDIDFESYSEAGFEWDDGAQKWRPPAGATKKGIFAVGAAVYAEHPSTEVLSVKYDLKDGLGARTWLPGMPPPLDLCQHLARFDPNERPSYTQAGLIEAHNSMFEVRIALHVLAVKYGWPRIDIRQFRCSMSKARAFSLPGALGNLGEVLGLAEQKDKEGKRLLDKFSVPRNPTKANPALRIRPEDDPADAAKLYQYNEQDIRTESDASRRLPDLIPTELDYWLADQACNWRGVGVDLASVHACIAVLEQAHAQYNAELYQITDGAVARASEASKLQAWVFDTCGLRMPSLDSDAVDAARGQLDPFDDTHRIVDRALEIRSLIGSASVKKVYAMARMATRDSRLCDLFNYHGARTGRDTHADVQPGNLPKAGPKLRWCESVGCERPYAQHLDACPWCGASAAFSRPDDWSAEAVEHALEIMAYRDLALVEYFFGDAVLTIAGCVRGLLVAAPGHDLICSDYSSIEAVVLAVLAGEEWRIKAFENGEQIYYHGAAGVTGKPYEWYIQYEAEHGHKHPDRNKIGKVCLAPETEVLTDRGYVRIVDVHITDKLWDGVEWVSHAGLLDQGQKEVMRLDGVRITPDHLVSTNGSWKAAKLLGSDSLSLTLALATGSASLPWSDRQKAQKAAESSPFNAIAAPRSTGSQSPTSLKGRLRGAINARGKRLRLTARCFSATPTQWLTTNIDAGCLTACLRLSAGAITRSKSSSPVTAAEASRCANFGATTSARFCATCKLCRGGTTRRWRWTGRTATGTMNRGTCGLSRGKQTRSTSEKLTILKRNLSFGGRMRRDLSDVYDLANAGPRRRFTIRTASGHLIVHNCELALGFMGWVGAWRNFDSSDTYTDDEVKQFIIKWREASPALVEFAGGQIRGTPWRPEKVEFFGLEGAFCLAVLNPGEVFDVRGIKFQMIGDALFVELLSGRRLTYHSPRLDLVTRREGWHPQYELSYMTWNSNPSMGALGWTRMNTYSGRLIENIVQATARDVMAHAVVNLERAGYPVVLRVHDEIAAEVPHGFGSVEEFEQIMATLPAWAEGWPIRAAGGWRGKRYRKD